MLRSYRNDSQLFQFVQVDEPRRRSENTFTVIVGKNGTGKSRLLRSIVTHLVDGVVERDALARDERFGLSKEPGGRLDIARNPSRIICVSTSPFDKFPLVRRDYLSDGYSYLGLRGLPSQNLGLAYMARIIFTLIGSAQKRLEQARSIAAVLEYLGYQGVIRVGLQVPLGRYIEDLLKDSDPAAALDHYIRGRMPMISDGMHPIRQLINLRETNPARFGEVIDAARKVFPTLQQRRVDVVVSSKGVVCEDLPDVDRDALFLLVSSGFFRLRDVILFKSGVDRPLKLHEASSGEQTVVMSLLGIGSQIRDGALICIDEPEVCLHPEWQEKYIELLFHTFGRYRGCHFIIATHSPQIVAQIPVGDCYVMAMEDGVARSANDFARHSIDYQLAKLFNAPGYKNEYLSRVALNILARVSKAKYLDDHSINDLVTLRKVFRELRDDDPLRELIISIEAMAKAYG